MKKVAALVEERLPGVDIVVFSDYDKGMASSALVNSVIEGARKYGKRVVVNPKPRNARQFKTAAIISINQSEAEGVSGIGISDERDLRRASARLLNLLKPEALLITRGPQGMRVLTADGDAVDIPAHLVEVYDVAGAGDTVVSVMALSLASGAEIREAAVLANCAGGAVVRKVGVATVTPAEIRTLLNEGDSR
jgi:D-beta-D-heptose 7-phosphate kinase/D-beta-D-heptose 1-phosphate adenosyltransferase